MLSYGWLHERQLSEVKPASLPTLKDITFQQRPVHVPFVLRNGSIFVQVYIGSKRVEGILDTGCNEVVWPEWMRLVGTQTGFFSTINDTQGLSQRANEVILNNISIGGYTIKRLRTYKVMGVHNPAKQPGTARQHLLLGNSFFLNTALTIDYSKKEITIQSPNCAFYEYRAKTDRYRVGFKWLPHDGSQRVGVPAIEGKINGRSALIEVDTDWNTNNIAIADRLWRHLASEQHWHTRPMRMGTSLGTTTVEYNDKLEIKIPVVADKNKTEITVITPAVRTNSATNGADAIIGTAFLSRYRVIINYPRQLVCLESFSH